MTFLLVLLVAAGGLAGAPARYIVDRVVSDRTDTELPVGTAIVNASGSALFGLLSGLALAHHVGPNVVALVGTGFCGAFTTFSTFTFEAVRLIEEGELIPAAITVVGSLVVGLLAAGAGVAVGLAI